jgi:hypothetical protein
MRSPGLELTLPAPPTPFWLPVPFATYPTISAREPGGVTLATFPPLFACSNPQTPLLFAFPFPPTHASGCCWGG